ncbi:tyrosine recombinase Int, partial [Lactobacillus helveticus MTCC 5463]
LTPSKISNVLKEVQDTLLNNFKAGRRNYTIFQVGKATLLRVSDVMGLKLADILIRTVLLNKMHSFTTENRQA